ncbi:hypothetical protein ACHAWF_009722 [Thalassiosira exigua]
MAWRRDGRVRAVPPHYPSPLGASSSLTLSILPLPPPANSNAKPSNPPSDDADVTAKRTLESTMTSDAPPSSSSARSGASSSSSSRRRLRGLIAASLAVATTTTTPAVAASASASDLDPDCTFPLDGGPYTGYSLKSGTACAEYVHCRDGEVSSEHECGSGTLFDGAVGKDGICDWARNVQCADEGSNLAFGPLAQGGAAVVAPAPVSAPAVPAAASSFVVPSPATNSGSYSSPLAPGASAASSIASNPERYYCGTSAADAALNCQPCPSGRMVDCGDDFSVGCFKGVTACASVEGLAVASSSQTQQAQGMQQTQQLTSQAGPHFGSVQQIVAEPSSASFGSSFGGNVNAVEDPGPIPAPNPTLPPWTNAPFGPSPSSDPKTVVGYYASWQWYDRDKIADPPKVDFSKYDRINYAFFQPDQDGYLYGTDEWADPQLLWGPIVWGEALQTPDNRRCSWDAPGVRPCQHFDLGKGIVSLAHAVGTQVWPSIGGWTLSENFPGIAAGPAKRQNFARQCVELIEAYDFDGIDLDWEYPGYEDHGGTPADTVNFTLLLRAVRDALDDLSSRKGGKFYGLTAALPCGPDKIAKIEVSKIKDILSELNLMSYDLHGAWDPLTGINAPLVDQGWGDSTPRWSVHGCVENYVALGAPLSKMNVGLPFYGRSFRSATGTKQFHGGVDDVNYHEDEGSPQYFNVVDRLKHLTTYRHEKTKTQYAVFGDQEGGLVSYDDPRAICDKVEYANRRGMNGFLVWEISGDMVERPASQGGGIVTPLIDVTNRKISNPDLPCDESLRDPTWAMSDGGAQYNLAPPEPTSVDWSRYVAPLGGGSGNDFDGALVDDNARPAPLAATSDAYDTPYNPVYVPPADLAGGGGRASSSSAFSGTQDVGDVASFSTVEGGGGGDKGGTGEEPDEEGESDDDCPLEYTGPFPTPGCAGYVYCNNGEVEGGSQPCSGGTLFDVTIGVCSWKETVRCGASRRRWLRRRSPTML